MPGPSQAFHGERDFTCHIGIEELGARILKDRPDQPGSLPGFQFGEVSAINEYPATHLAGDEVGGKPVRQFRDRGLPRTGRSAEQHAFARRDLEIDLGYP